MPIIIHLASPKKDLLFFTITEVNFARQCSTYTPTLPGAEIWDVGTYPLRPRTRQDFICCCCRCLYNLVLNTHFLAQKTGKTGSAEINVVVLAPRSIYHLPGNVTSAAVGLVLVYINLQEE